MAIRIQLRRDTTANWASVDPVLAEGEAGYDLDTGELRIGDGSTAYSGLTPISGGGGGAVDSVNGYTGVVTLAASDVGAQPSDSDLTAIAGLTSAADKGIQFTGSGTAGTYDLTTAGKALLDDADAAAQRTTLGLGTAATKDSGAAGAAGKVLNADDASTANARTPTAHKSSHATGGSDALAPSDIGAAPLDSPTFTGNPQAPTPSQGDNDASVATTAFVQTEAGLLVPKSLVDAKGDLLVGTADNTIARKAVGADGSRLIADSSKSDGLDWEEKKLYTAVKTAQEDVTNSDTLQDDDHLFLTLPTGRFVIDWTLYTAGASTAADWKFGLTGTATSAGIWGPILTGANAQWGGTTAAQSPAALASLVQTITLGGANVAGGGFILRGLVYISVAGTLKLQWAQNTATSGVTNTLYTGSCMIGTKVG